MSERTVQELIEEIERLEKLDPQGIDFLIRAMTDDLKKEIAKKSRKGSELRFASTEEALQHLADITGKQVRIAGAYEKIYEVEIPKDHNVMSEHVKTYPAGRFAEIEKYADGYFAVVNRVHGTQVFWTKKWQEAKERASDIGFAYNRIAGDYSDY